MDNKKEESFAAGKQFVEQYFKNVNELDQDSLKKYLIMVRNLRRDESGAKVPTKEIINSIAEGNGKKAIHFAAARGNLEVFQFLRKKGADTRALDDKGNNPLIIAVQHNHTKIVQFLIDECRVNVNYARDTVTPLHLAAQQGNIPMIELLLSAGANINALSNFGSPVAFAVACNQNWSAIHLIEKGADLNVSAPQMPTLLHLVIDQDNEEMFHNIIHKVDVNKKDPAGWSALQLCAEKGAIKYLDALIQQGAEVDYENEQQTSLDLAAFNNHWNCVEKLREISRRKEPKQPKKVDPIILTEEQSTILMEQILNEKKEGNVLFTAGQFKEAGNIYQQILLKAEPLYETKGAELVSICTNLASCLNKLGQYKDALKTCLLARQLNKEWIKTFYQEGLAYEGLEDYGEAAASYFEALKVEQDPFFKKQFDNAIAKGKEHHKKHNKK